MYHIVQLCKLDPIRASEDDALKVALGGGERDNTVWNCDGVVVHGGEDECSDVSELERHDGARVEVYFFDGGRTSERRLCDVAQFNVLDERTLDPRSEQFCVFNLALDERPRQVNCLCIVGNVQFSEHRKSSQINSFCQYTVLVVVSLYCEVLERVFESSELWAVRQREVFRVGRQFEHARIVSVHESVCVHVSHKSTCLAPHSLTHIFLSLK